jgi:hypothetical protein
MHYAMMHDLVFEPFELFIIRQGSVDEEISTGKEGIGQSLESGTSYLPLQM